MQPAQCILVTDTTPVKLPGITSIQMVTACTFSLLKGLKGPDGVTDVANPSTTTFPPGFTLFLNTTEVTGATGSFIINRQATTIR